MPESATRPVFAHRSSAEPPVVGVVAAFAAVYVIWGSTYLGIRWAIESVPPLLMASGRFLIAGSLLHVWCRARSAARPTSKQWRTAAIAGTLMLGGGNGAVVIAEQWVPSGLTALLVAVVPLWMVLFDALFGSKARPSARAQTGLTVGFAGVALLGGTPGVGEGGAREILGALLVLGGSASWAAGSLYLRGVSDSPRPLLGVSMQMIVGGGFLGLLSCTLGEAAGFRWAEVSLRSTLALAYLIVFGALIAYSSYVWLLKFSTPARIGTYAYVNPVIALFLGWALAGETLAFRSVMAAAIIVGSVIVIVSEARPLSSRGVPAIEVDRRR